MKMSAVSKLSIRKVEKEKIQPNTLLEHLYTQYSLEQLEEMLTVKPDDATLLVWNVNSRDFAAIVQRAIEFVRED